MSYWDEEHGVAQAGTAKAMVKPQIVSNACIFFSLLPPLRSAKLGPLFKAHEYLGGGGLILQSWKRRAGGG